MKRIIAFYLLIQSISLLAQKEIQVTDLTKIQTVSAVSFSPNGAQILYSVLSIIPDPKDKWEYSYVNQIWIADATGATPPHQLTFQKEGAASPSWSPDGNSIAFVRSVDSKPQIFILPLTGGEAWQLTMEKNGASNPIWSPNGKSIVFSSVYSLNELSADSILNPSKSVPLWPMEKAGFKDNDFVKPNTNKSDPNGSVDEVRAYLALNEKDKKAKVITKLVFQQESTTSNDLSFTHLFLIETKPGAKSVPLTNGYYSYANAQFIPNTVKLLIQSDIDPTEHPDRSQEGEIYTLDLKTKQLQKILGKQGMNYNQAVISPSGKSIAFTQSTTNAVSIPKLSIMPLAGTEKDIRVMNHDRSINVIRFAADEKSLYIESPSNGGVVLYNVDLTGSGSYPLTSFDEGIGSFDFSSTQFAFAKTAISSPSELYVSGIDLKSHKALTQNNSSWLTDRRISKPEKFSFKNEKGQSIEYWVMKPANFESGKKYPTILDIHGGPTAMWGPGELSMWHEFQYYCGKGFVVVYCNPRGSGGYGNDFMRANINDWGKGPTADVLKSLDLAGSQGYIDTNKLAVTGGSYAGYLVAWIISHDQRFKAACSQRGVYDLTTFFGEGNAWRLVPNYFGGYPWQPEALKNLERESPITYVQNIKTPYLIFHGEQDLRTGVIQSEQMYKSLKVMGKTVEYVRHPGATHELTRSGNNRQRIDQMLRTWEFFDRFISTKS
ncbi:MAG: S9 family peptidase [Saprospiraceae bacterium]